MGCNNSADSADIPQIFRNCSAASADIPRTIYSFSRGRNHLRQAYILSGIG